MNRGSTQPSRSDQNPLEETIQREESPMDILDSIGKVNLGGILNKTLEGTNEMLKLLEEEEPQSQTLKTNTKT